MESTLQGVFACGAAVPLVHSVSDERMWPTSMSAMRESARVAAKNAATLDPSGFEKMGKVPFSQLLTVGDLSFGCTGLTLAAARRLFGENNVVSQTVHHVEPHVSVTAFAERRSHLLLGAFAYGDGNASFSSLIALLATFIAMGASPERVLSVDFFGFASSKDWDVLHETALLLNAALKEGEEAISSDRLALWMAERRDFLWIDLSPAPDQPKLPDKVMSMSVEQLRQKLRDIDAATPIVLSSQSGRTAMLAHRMLRQNGFRDVYHLEGGPLSWASLQQ